MMAETDSREKKCWPCDPRWWPLLVLALSCELSAIRAAERWQGRLASGELITAPEILEWNEPASKPTLAGRALLDAQQPFQSLWDEEAPAVEAPVSYVELIGGDRLTGVIQGWQAAGVSPYHAVPPHLLIQPTMEIFPNDGSPRLPVRVATRWLRKVVWSSQSGTVYEPATVWLKEGGRVAFRSVRWTESGVTLLTESGLRSFSFHELGELHFPQTDDWEAYQQALVVLSPGLKSRLAQLDLANGSRLTTSMERFQARHWGDRKRPQAWWQLVQPVWALDPLWIPFPQITSWYWFLPEEPPLSWSAPVRVERQPVFGSSWLWRGDLNTLGQPLLLGDSVRHLRGFGVHGSTSLTFSLPAAARAFRTQAGLDRAAGTGGSVQLSVQQEGAEPLFATEPLIGSSQVVDSGWKSFAAADATASRTLTFRSDMLRDSAPAGADPFDIRDIVSWGSPTLRLDRETLLAQQAQFVPAAIPGLSGWTIAPDMLVSLKYRNWLDETDHRVPAYRGLWSTDRPFVVLSRKVTLSSADRWLSLIVSRFEASSVPTRMQIKLDGRSAGEFEIPVRQGPIDPAPVTVPVPEGGERTVQVDVVIYAGTPDSWWEWRGLVATPEPPGIRTLFDEVNVAWLPDPAAGSASIETGGAFSGEKFLRVPAGRLDIPSEERLSAVIAELPRLGEYRFLTFAWKGKETPRLAFSLAHEGRLRSEIAGGLGLGGAGNPAVGPNGRFRKLEERGLRAGFTWEAGAAEVEDGLKPIRVQPKVPMEWQFVTRDLTQDFGPLLLTGLGWECQQSGAGDWDAIVLARTPQDAQALQQRYATKKSIEDDPHYSQKAVRPEDWGPAVAAFAPAFGTPNATHGLLQKREHQGQVGGWQTHPEQQDKPLILRTVHQFPADRPQELDLLVSHQPGSDFQLLVRVNHEVLLDQLIDQELTQPQRGWASLTVDLSKFQGQTVLVEVLNASNNWSNEHAVWKRLEIRDRAAP